jgi:hypothetical protein
VTADHENRRVSDMHPTDELIELSREIAKDSGVTADERDRCNSGDPS